MYWIKNEISQLNEQIVKYEETITALNFIIPKLESYPNKILDKRFFELEDLKISDGTFERRDPVTDKWVIVPRKFSPFNLYDRSESYGKKYAFGLGGRTHCFQTGSRQREDIIHDAKEHLTWSQDNLKHCKNNLASVENLDMEAFISDIRKLWIKYGKPSCWTKMLDTFEVKYPGDK